MIALFLRIIYVLFMNNTETIKLEITLNRWQMLFIFILLCFLALSIARWIVQWMVTWQNVVRN